MAGFSNANQEMTVPFVCLYSETRSLFGKFLVGKNYKLQSILRAMGTTFAPPDFLALNQAGTIDHAASAAKC
jgi:hypothetical protein